MLVLCAAVLAGCGLGTERRLMLHLNRAYLDMRQHIEAADFPALEADGARMAAMVERMQEFNDEPPYQEQADALGALARRVEAAGRARALEDARAAFLDLNRPCTECHRVYRVRGTVH